MPFVADGEDEDAHSCAPTVIVDDKADNIDVIEVMRAVMSSMKGEEKCDDDDDNDEDDNDDDDGFHDVVTQLHENICQAGG